MTVRRTRFASAETGWAVVDAAGEDGTPIVLVGPLVHLEERERAHVVGTWVQDSRYGPQVKVTEARPLPPSDLPAVIAYLCRVKHIGAKRARWLVERYGAATVLDAIDDDPFTAFSAAGIRRGAVGDATRSWEQLRVTRRLHLLLAPHGLAYLAGRIRETYGDSAHRIVSRAAVRADERVRRRVPHRGSDRTARRRRSRQPRSRAGRRAARAVRGRARRQHLHAGRPADALRRRAARLAPDDRDAPRRPRRCAATSCARSSGSTGPRPPSSRPSWPSGSQELVAADRRPAERARRRRPAAPTTDTHADRRAARGASATPSPTGCR